MSDDVRLLFRYLGGEEVDDYRSILRVFAGTFFAEFSPDDVAVRLRAAGAEIDAAVLPTRLESLRGWGNLTVSSSVGRPTSLDDYYRRRNRYLITRIGQEVFEFAEQLFQTADQIGDLQTGRLRDLAAALTQFERLADQIEHGNAVNAEEFADSVRRVFELHESFTTELTQFFAELNQWQARYDLNPEEVQFLANVLVNYVAEQVAEIEVSMRPIATTLTRVRPRLTDLLPRLNTGLAARATQTGHAETFNIRRFHGTQIEDWDHMAAWFNSLDGKPPRLEQLTRQGFAAVRTLTANLTRLSRESLGAASRQADFTRLAGWFHQAPDIDAAHDLASAAFGLGSCRSLARLAEDHGDPIATTTSWRQAPRAIIPVSLRERGDVAQRGNASPVRDRGTERELMRRRRELEQSVRARLRSEILDAATEDGRLDDVNLSIDAFRAVRDAMGRARLGGVTDVVTCELVRWSTDTTLRCSDGELTLREQTVFVR